MSEHITNASQLTMSPATLARFQDRAEWLPVREVIREAAAFAISRQGNDNAVDALLNGLAGLGITIPENATASVTLTGNVRISDSVRLVEAFSTDENVTAFLAAALRVRDMFGYGYHDTNNPANHNVLANAVRMARVTFPEWSVESGQSSVGRAYADSYTPRAAYFSHNVTLNLSRMIPACDADDLDEWRTRDELRTQAMRFLPAVNRYMVGMMVRLSGGLLTREMLTCREDYDSVSTAARIPWTDEDSTRIAAAGEHADELAGRHEYLRTNSFLAMMRDQAVENSWCGEHHRIIDTLTNGTRRPYGKVITVTRTVEQEFTFTADTFYGVDMEDVQQSVEDMLANGSNIRYAIRDRFGAYPDVTLDEHDVQVVMRNTED
jgi:hypothetical protein